MTRLTRLHLVNRDEHICQALSSGKGSSISAPADFVAPEPQKYTVTEGQLGRVLHSAVPLVVRLGTGKAWNQSSTPHPSQKLKDAHFIIMALKRL
jgi:hypothetical protein